METLKIRAEKPTILCEQDLNSNINQVNINENPDMLIKEMKFNELTFDKENESN